MANALLVIAEGSEEMETVIIYDLLVRGGINLTLASVSSLQIKASRGLTLTADCSLETVKSQAFDIIICPGGLPGAQHLQASSLLSDMLCKQHKRGAFIAAICAAPAEVFNPLGLLDNVQATGFPSTAERIPSYVDEPVVVGDQIITSQGPGTSMAFALKIIESLMGEIMAKEVAATALISR